MADTPILGIPYPDDYADPADTPAVMEAMALKVEQVILPRARVYVQASQPIGPSIGDLWVVP